MLILVRIYEYSCGGFLSTAKIPPTQNMLDYGGMQENIDVSNNSEYLGEWPTRPQWQVHRCSKSNFSKAQGFYKSCMNETRITEVGRVTLFKELEELVTTVVPVQGNSLISHFPNIAPLVDPLNTMDRERLTSAIAHLYRVSTLSILNFYSFPDERSPEIQTLWTSRGDSVVPDPVLLEGTPLLVEYCKAIEEIYTFVFGKSEGATKFANDVIGFETKIANFSDGADASTGGFERIVSFPGLALAIQKILHGTNITLDRKLKNYFPPYLNLLDKLLQETPASTLQTYFA
ncbi:hypothetical protein BGZ74_010463 [Mortierella antarctica]|nr:hypothetical protein BGZ74_010463 [Mortierella antarctica]